MIMIKMIKSNPSSSGVISTRSSMILYSKNITKNETWMKNSQFNTLQSEAVPEKKWKKNYDATTTNNFDEFTFSYEKENDPEIFFVPCVWEAIVCIVASSTVEWKKDNIHAFELLDPIIDDDDKTTKNGTNEEENTVVATKL